MNDDAVYFRKSAAKRDFINLLHHGFKIVKNTPIYIYSTYKCTQIIFTTKRGQYFCCFASSFLFNINIYIYL